MAGKWSQAGVPHKGWTCVGIDDLDDALQTCEMCEKREIRFVHHMEHPDYPETLGVGCICAGHMEGDYQAARQREKSTRATSQRRARWFTRKWRVSAAGNRYMNVDGFNITVYRRGATWGFSIKNVASQDSIPSRKPYMTEDDACRAMFDALGWVKARDKDRTSE